MTVKSHKETLANLSMILFVIQNGSERLQSRTAATQKIWNKFRIFEKIFEEVKKMAPETRTFDGIKEMNTIFEPAAHY